MDVEIGFLHCSDLNPQKPINWKRTIDINGEYGAMGDLGPHVLHIPLRIGWMPSNLRSLLTNVMTERPDSNGKTVPCETWDNATLATQVEAGDQEFPMVITAKRIAPGHTNTWYINVYGTEFSAEYSTRNPKVVKYLPYAPGDDQAWRTLDIGFSSVYPTITGGIFEFGMPDALLQMFAAFCDELTNGRTDEIKLYCPTPAEANQIHKIFTAALESDKTDQTVHLSDIG
jgi:predicted dehydrogenase